MVSFVVHRLAGGKARRIGRGTVFPSYHLDVGKVLRSFFGDVVAPVGPTHAHAKSQKPSTATSAADCRQHYSENV
ncbi:hypothetical protein BVRB_1g008730 [Beta vulgaris subsp. vulgaris]|nr:hypothetical protein BVRB_1g008730 [Beta vulgaris subsp. vulgaris]